MTVADGMNDSYPMMSRPTFVLVRPPGAEGILSAAESHLPYRLARRGHRCIVSTTQPELIHRPNWCDDVTARLVSFCGQDDLGRFTANDQLFFLVIGREIDTGSRPQIVLTGEISKTVRNEDWERNVSMFVAVSYKNFPGIVTSNIRGFDYHHINHFVFGHLDEEQSRHDWLNVGPGDVMIDVGASIGSWSLPAAALGAKVYAFEPGTDGHQLADHIALNKFEDRITTLANLVSDTNGQPVPVEEIPWHSVEPKYAVPASRTITLDQAVQKLKLNRVDFLKIDVDGSEMKVLHGAHSILAAMRPQIVVEIHNFLGVEPSDVLTYIQSFGYTTKLKELEVGFYLQAFCTPDEFDY